MDVEYHMENCRRFLKQVLGEAIRGFWDAFVFGKNHKIRVNPLPILLVYGLVGILVDLDHLLIGSFQRIRPLHVEYLFCFWVVGVCYYTYVHRRVHKTMLEGDND